MPTVNGQYSLPSGYRATPGQTIKSSQHNPPLEDLAVAMNGRMTRDGSAGMTGNIPMGGNKVTGLGAATDSSDAPRLDQVTPYDPYLAAVAELTKSADKFPYATGANTAALATLTAAARTFLAAVDAAAQRSVLGLGGLATVDILDEDDFASNSATRPPSQQSAKAYADGQNNLAANGSKTLPGGLIIKWGSVATTGDGTFAKTFPNPFPNNCVSLTVQMQELDGDDGEYCAKITSAAGFDLLLDSNLGGIHNFYYQAFGY